LEAELGRLVACATLNQIPLVLIPWDVMEDVGTLWEFLRTEVAMFGHQTAAEALGLTQARRAMFNKAYLKTWRVEVK